MSYGRRRHRPDANESQIVEALRTAGAEVWIIDQPFDLLVAYQSQLLLMEVKDGDNKLSQNQQDDRHKLWFKGVHLHVVRSVDEALAALQERQ